jgi:putative methionine-R-sulfoxide reductase with GAF domain
MFWGIEQFDGTTAASETTMPEGVSSTINESVQTVVIPTTKSSDHHLKNGSNASINATNSAGSEPSTSSNPLHSR